MKKIIFISVALIAALGLCACGSSGAKSSVNSNPVISSETVPTTETAGTKGTSSSGSTNNKASNIKKKNHSEASDESSAIMQSYYLGGILQKSPSSGSSTYVTKFELTSKTLSVTGVFCKANSFDDLGGKLNNPESFKEYNFTVTNATKYFGQGGDTDTPYEYSKDEFNDICKKLNGLFLILQIEGTTVTSATVAS